MSEIIKVKINDIEYDTIIDKAGRQVFVRNNVLHCIHIEGGIDLEQLNKDFEKGCFSEREFMEFYMSLGYSLCAIIETFSVEDGLYVDNPFDDVKL